MLEESVVRRDRAEKQNRAMVGMWRRQTKFSLYTNQLYLLERTVATNAVGGGESRE